MTTTRPSPLLAAVRRELRRRGDPARAAGAKAYMKSAMPFHGVDLPTLRTITRRLFAGLAFDSPAAWRRAVLGLWRGARWREERYAALELLKLPRFRPFLDSDALPMLEEMISTGAWWDLVDPIATRPLGEILARAPRETRRRLLAWSTGEDRWLRRSAILAQLHFRERTDAALFERLLAPSLASREFFLAKAIGWALRSHAVTDPAWVRRYVRRNRDRMAPLAIREALKHLGEE